MCRGCVQLGSVNEAAVPSPSARSQHLPLALANNHILSNLVA